MHEDDGLHSDLLKHKRIQSLNFQSLSEEIRMTSTSITFTDFRYLTFPHKKTHNEFIKSHGYNYYTLMSALNLLHLLMQVWNQYDVLLRNKWAFLLFFTIKEKLIAMPALYFRLMKQLWCVLFYIMHNGGANGTFIFHFSSVRSKLLKLLHCLHIMTRG